MTSRRAELLCKSNCPNQPRHMPGRLAPFPARRRAMLLVLVLAAVGWEAYAQDLEPRARPNRAELPDRRLRLFDRWRGDRSVAAVAKRATSRSIVRPRLRSLSGCVGEVREGRCGGTLCLALGSADVAGQPREREVSGFGDPRFRFSVNFYGAPALSLQEFAGYSRISSWGPACRCRCPSASTTPINS